MSRSATNNKSKTSFFITEKGYNRNAAAKSLSQTAQERNDVITEPNIEQLENAREIKLNVYLGELGTNEREFNERRPLLPNMRKFKGYYPPFAQIPLALLFDKRRSAKEKILFLIHHSLADKKNLRRNPKVEVYQEDIIEITGWSRKTAYRSQLELEKSGWEEKIQQGFGKPNIVYLNPRPTIKWRSNKKCAEIDEEQFME